MRVKLQIGENEKRFIDRIAELSGENIYACYQCGRCSAGCPFAGEMDILPNQIIRNVQMGQVEELTQSKAIFLCASCFTCQSRCPKGIDISRIAESIRLVADQKGADFFGPGEVPVELAEELPQQVLVSIFKKFSK